MNGTAAASFAISMLLIMGAADAHQPRLVMDENPTRESPVVVTDPTISKAYYGEMGGSSEYYKIVSDSDFVLYLNLLVPDYHPFNKRVFSADVRDSNGSLVTMLDGSNSTWRKFHEDFGNDDYLMGPEKRMDMPAGEYEVRVFNHDNEGRYSLVVGEAEYFPPGEISNAALLVPQIKQRFFGSSPLESVFNFSGALLVAGILAGAGVVLIFRKSLHRKKTRTSKRKKKRRILS
ncbi:MAG: hypothetical protein HY833_03290 [Candidatus Aenigmarchaeota archaeon]|nr:hypothetical protein [Candidatus Aenigmarchaeota archaeon]